jgi:hypothetical protein
LANGGNGWRTGADPILRWLRTAAVVAFLVVFVVVSLDGDRDVTTEAPVLGIAVGAVLILLGYQGVIRLPMIGRDSREDDK